jgi:hypothetical protein
MFWVLALVFFLLEPVLLFLIFRKVNRHLVQTGLNLKDLISPLVFIFYWLYYSIFQLLLGLEMFSRLSLDAIFFKWLIIVILSKAGFFLWFISSKNKHQLKSHSGSNILLVLLSIYWLVYVIALSSDCSFVELNMNIILCLSKAFLSGSIWISVPLLVLFRTR